MSLNKNHHIYKNYNLPSYNENVIKSNVKIIYGEDNAGDITKLNNIHLFKTLFKGTKVDFVTADGGFDEGNDFNNKEQLHYNLFLTEIIYGLIFLNKKGNFLLKFFDTFTETSIDLLWLLANCFKEIYIYKPYTSRPTNSEKYIICKDFLGISESLETDLISIFTKINQPSMSSSKYNSFRLFENNSIPHAFKNMVFLINQTILNGQCHFLQEAITLCYDTSFINSFGVIKNKMVSTRKLKFEEWKKRFNFNK